MENLGVIEEGASLNMKIKYVMLIIGLILIIGGGFVFINRGISDTDDVSSSSVSPLNTRSDMEWDTIVNSITKDDATTNCYNHLIEGTHHTLYCDKIAGSDTETDFKMFFKTANTRDVKITEIKTTQEDLINYIEKETPCPPESKNTTCTYLVPEVYGSYQSKSYNIISMTQENQFDYKSNLKSSFKKEEKITYKIEWEDVAPATIKSFIQGNTFSGKLSFPMQSIYTNELKINPTKAYNYSTNN